MGKLEFKFLIEPWSSLSVFLSGCSIITRNFLSLKEFGWDLSKITLNWPKQTDWLPMTHCIYHNCFTSFSNHLVLLCGLPGTHNVVLPSSHSGGLYLQQGIPFNNSGEFQSQPPLRYMYATQSDPNEYSNLFHSIWLMYAALTCRLGAADILCYLPKLKALKIKWRFFRNQGFKAAGYSVHGKK